MDCQYCDEHGFCKKYSNFMTVWKCKGDADCDEYVEGEENVGDETS